jgi:Tol biopolymer transport system component
MAPPSPITADYDGSNSIYTIPSTGGIPTRLTWYGSPERVADWYPDGKSILFASGRESGRERFNQFYKITRYRRRSTATAHYPIAEYGTLSPDASHIALPSSHRYSATGNAIAAAGMVRSISSTLPATLTKISQRPMPMTSCRCGTINSMFLSLRQRRRQKNEPLGIRYHEQTI